MLILFIVSFSLKHTQSIWWKKSPELSTVFEIFVNTYLILKLSSKVSNITMVIFNGDAHHESVNIYVQIEPNKISIIYVHF